jgi:hypothetical protein
MPHSDDALGTEVIGDVGVCCQRTTAGLCFQRKKKNHVEVPVGGCVTEVSVESNLKHANHFRIHCEVGGNSINVSFHPL